MIGDAGAVASMLVAPEALRVRRLHVAVELAGGRTRGMTVCDGRSEVCEPDGAMLEPNVDVIVGVDAEALKRVYTYAETVLLR